MSPYVDLDLFKCFGNFFSRDFPHLSLVEPKLDLLHQRYHPTSILKQILGWRVGKTERLHHSIRSISLVCGLHSGCAIESERGRERERGGRHRLERKIGVLFFISQRNVESRTQASPLNYAREVKTSVREREREREGGDGGREREREREQT